MMPNNSAVCVYCGSLESSLRWSVNDMYGTIRDLRCCAHCQTWFYNPQPSKEQLDIAYSNSYYGETETKFRWSIVEKSVDYFRMLRARRLHRLIQRKGRVLDIGCGNGRFLHKLYQMGGVEVCGTELPGNSAERAKSYSEINLFCGSFAQSDFPTASFDAVTLFHVFEHLPEPASALSKINELLKPGGVLLVSFPNIKSLQAQLLRQHWLHLDPPRHLFFPSPNEFVTQMSALGFTLIRRKFFSPEQNPVGMVQGLLNVFSGKRDVLFERMKGNTAYAPEFGKGRMFFHKLFFVCAMPYFMLGDLFESLAGAGATVEFTFRKNNIQ